jgi:hypothetical protein
LTRLLLSRSSIIYGEATEGDGDNDDESCTIQRELLALKSFQEALQESMGAYNNAGINLKDRTLLTQSHAPTSTQHC